MEFLDEDARPRFLFQSRQQASSLDNDNGNTEYQKPTKLFVLICISVSIILFSVSFFFIENELFQYLFFWFSLSLIIGPFAPSHITGGHTRVGHGPILENPIQDPQIEPETKKKPHKNRSSTGSNKSQDSPVPVIENSIGSNGFVSKDKKIEVVSQKENVEEKDWSEEDIEILKKQMVKNPVGKPKRWEVIAEAFNGRHRVESVIKKSKELGEKKIDDKDSYDQFLKNRKLDERIQGKTNEGLVVENGEDKGWSATEDIALLNALKAFPKEASMRWEKIAAAVPGKTKAGCMKRVAELKKGFRSSKAGGAES